MNATNTKTETCRLLMAKLHWSESHLDQSIKIAVSKAIWLGLELQDVFELARTLPSAENLQQCPLLVAQAWTSILQADPNQHLTEYEQLLNAVS